MEGLGAPFFFLFFFFFFFSGGGGGWGGEGGFQVKGLMYEKVRFPYLLSLMRGKVMRPSSAERREREG